MKGERDNKGDGKKWNYKTKRQQRLGGKTGGLSLEAFSKLKSMPSGFNPSLIKKQREFYKNAKLVKKYKTSVKPENHQSYQLKPQAYEEGEGSESVPKHRKKKRQTLESLKEESERKRQEKESERLEREAMIKAKKEAIEKAESKRKVLKDNMFKKTRSGQPVMKYRIQHMLDGLLDTEKK
ncbi:stress response protein nst1 isoform X2 [Carex littledalei]|uniref:Stress response protein nst1 isoform X2 n=1 Tax=Carex littledalei TaxID=544730 RepID=A0A833RJR4_9POAL|nr:stress response protein nst1 isoform X2 [Carex littledalei]